MSAAYPPTPDADGSPIEADVRALSAIHRPSASDGERRSAQWLAGRLRELGLEPRIEEESASGDYWSSLGLLNAAAALAALAALRGHRRTGLALAGGATAGLVDDIRAGAFRFRRAVLPRRTTYNVVADLGDPGAPRTVVLSAHHDAPHAGLIFHPAPQRWFFERFPGLLESANTSAPSMWGVVGGPLAVALGSALGSRALLRGGLVNALGTVAAMVDVGRRDAVPGANDNASAVAAALAVARALVERPVEGVRVVLLFPGSEESLMEGMNAFGARHFGELLPESTAFVNLESVGSPELVLLEGEGMLGVRDYPAAFRELVAEVAREAGIALKRGQRTRNATDGLIPMRAGYPSVSLVSIAWWKSITNYHWKTDVPENVSYDTAANAATLSEAVIRRVSERPASAPFG